MHKVFITNVAQYTGPGIMKVLKSKGYHLICHDSSFSCEATRLAFEKEHDVQCLSLQSPSLLIDYIKNETDLFRFVVNDVHPNQPKPFDEIDSAELESAFDALVLFPFALSKGIFSMLRQQKRGHLLFITSARQLQPEPGFAVATTVRSAATAMAMSLSREAAPLGIQVNVLQPNYLYSEMYYPKSHFIESEEGRSEIAAKVPMGRLGRPEELGELAELLISGRSSFTTGQVINFTGGWP